MKLRLNTTLRAALIAAVTAVGFTLTQAQAAIGTPTASNAAGWFTHEDGTWTYSDNCTTQSGAVGDTFSFYTPGTTNEIVFGTSSRATYAFAVTLNASQLRVSSDTILLSGSGLSGIGMKSDRTLTETWISSATWGSTDYPLPDTGSITIVHSTGNSGSSFAVYNASGEELFWTNAPTGLKGAPGMTNFSINEALASSLVSVAVWQPSDRFSQQDSLAAAQAMKEFPLVFEDFTWNGTSDNHAWSGSVWNTGMQTNVQFVNGGNAEFTATGNATVDITSSVTAHNLTVGGKDYTFVIQSGGSLAADAVVLAADGNLTIENKSGSSQAVGSVSGAGNMVLTAGTFSIGDFASSGKLVVSDNGTLELGDTRHNIGTLEIGDGGVVTTTRNDGAGCVSGNIDINAGGVFKVAGGHDAFGYNTPTQNITLTGSAEKIAELKLDQTTPNSVTMKTNLKLMGHALVSTTKNGFNTFGCSIHAEGEDNTIQQMQLRSEATIEVAAAGELSVGNMVYGNNDGNHNLTKTGEGTLTFTGTANMKKLNLNAGTVVLNGTSSVENGLTVASGATLSSQTGTITAAITFDDGACLDVGDSGLVLSSDDAVRSTLTLNGKINFSTSASAETGEVIVASGLSEEGDIIGITFEEGIADASKYLVLDTSLTGFTQLKYKDGSLMLLKVFNGLYWGVARADNNWNLESVNWAENDGDTASTHFSAGLDAYFTASGGGGTVAMTTPVSVATLSVSGESYTFTNANNLTITGGINISESGSATFDALTGEIQTVSIDATSSMTVSSGNMTVQDLSNKGSLTVSGDLSITTATDEGGNVEATNLKLASGENTFASLQVSGKVSGADSIKVGGTSSIGNLEGASTLTQTDGTLNLGTASGLTETTLSGALTAGAGVDLGAVTMNDGSSIQSTGAVTASGITVNGAANIGGTTTLQTGTVAGGTLKVNSGSTLAIADGGITEVSGTLQMLSGSTMDNRGMLSVSGRVIAADGNALGMVNATGTIEVNGAVSAAGGSIANLDMGAGDSLNVAQDLALASTTGTEGSLTVGGNLTVTGDAFFGEVSAATLDLDISGTLTATGTLNATTITLARVSNEGHYLTAEGLSDTSLNFWVDEEQIAALGLHAGQIITLADLDSVHAGAANLTVNGGKYITDDKELSYYISQDSETKDIILTVQTPKSNYVWTNGGGTANWSDEANWSGGSVPDSEAWVQVVEGDDVWTILLDENGEARRLTIDSGRAEITGANELDVYQSLEVNSPATLDLTETVKVKAKDVNVDGMLNMDDDASLYAETINVRDGSLTLRTLSYVETKALNIGSAESGADGIVHVKGGGLSADTINMDGETILFLESDAVAATQALNGTQEAVVHGRVNITGTGGRYAGGYDNACIDIVEGADATLAAGEGLTLTGDGTAKLQYSGNAAIAGVDADALTIILNNPNVSNIGSTLTLQQPSRLGNGSVQFGMSALDSAKTIGSGAPVILQGDLSLGDGAAVVVNQDSADSGVALDVRNGGSTRNLVLARFGGANTNTRNVTLTGYLYGKYYRNARIENGALLVDLRDDFYRTVSGAHTPNGIAGGRMVDAAFVERNPQISNPNGDLAAVMTALETGAIPTDAADKTLAAMSGASIAAMGAAFGADVDRQLRAIRNRTTTMGLSDCLVNENLPYFNAWVNAEGDYRKLNADGTLAGYRLSSWGGTVGFDVDCTPRFTCGVALTAMQGNFTASSAESADGDLDRLYVSAFARYTRRALTQTLVATFGRADAKLHRTVNYGAGAYRADADTNGTAFGVMYEIGYAKALNEDATTCLQPVLNLSYRHSALDGFKEKGLSDAALTAGDAEMNVFTAALGARLQSVVGTSVYNRSSLFEGRVLLKLDSGDRDVAVRNHFAGVAGGADAMSAEVGAFGVEIGAGITLPIAEDGGSLFFDVTGEFRSGYSEVNGTVGYRFNF